MDDLNICLNLWNIYIVRISFYKKNVSRRPELLILYGCRNLNVYSCTAIRIARNNVFSLQGIQTLRYYKVMCKASWVYCYFFCLGNNGDNFKKTFHIFYLIIDI